jgi:hypothetical protein
MACDLIVLRPTIIPPLMIDTATSHRGVLILQGPVEDGESFHPAGNWPVLGQGLRGDREGGPKQEL